MSCYPENIRKPSFSRVSYVNSTIQLNKKFVLIRTSYLDRKHLSQLCRKICNPIMIRWAVLYLITFGWLDLLRFTIDRICELLSSEPEMSFTRETKFGWCWRILLFDGCSPCSTCHCTWDLILSFFIWLQLHEPVTAEDLASASAALEKMNWLRHVKNHCIFLSYRYK